MSQNTKSCDIESHLQQWLKNGKWILTSFSFPTINKPSSGMICKFLPSYSPDFNPIELVFSKFKAYIKRRQHIIASHWGQGGKYPAGTWWTHCDNRHHFITMCPAIKSWAHFECLLAMRPQCAQWLKIGHILNVHLSCDHNVPSDQKLPNVLNVCRNAITMCPVIKTWAHFKCLPAMWPICVWWLKIGHILNVSPSCDQNVPCDQKLPHVFNVSQNAITMCPAVKGWEHFECSSTMRSCFAYSRNMVITCRICQKCMRNVSSDQIQNVHQMDQFFGKIEVTFWMRSDSWCVHHVFKMYLAYEFGYIEVTWQGTFKMWQACVT